MTDLQVLEALHQHVMVEGVGVVEVVRCKIGAESQCIEQWAATRPPIHGELVRQTRSAVESSCYAAM